MSTPSAAPDAAQPTAGRAAEARRQVALLAAIQGAPPPQTVIPPGPGTADAHILAWQSRGLALHRAHARATACATLRLSHPTVEQVLGAKAFDTLACRLWALSPPTSGDLGDWGEGLPALLAQQPELLPWPWLPDLARLDWARHRCERAADQACDLPSLARLGDTDPARLHLRLQEHVIALPSPWPLPAIWAAHQPGGDLDALNAVLAPWMAQAPRERPQGLTVIWRQPWRAEVMDVMGPEARWMRALCPAEAERETPPSLATLLDQAAPDFDFTAWLTRALQRQWLAGVDVR
ncbi:putative DNA-binding domain-containing protein [Aquabacterium sp.]|uniref:HvfC/BufC family peptide modification chaperone n=1 Tax=Aquabacterium sp. TaxID=1872578 RepID=UPI0025BCB713|nr:putative DNA-binding domain-containing protein [Aquabacterium sp.]